MLSLNSRSLAMPKFAVNIMWAVIVLFIFYTVYSHFNPTIVEKEVTTSDTTYVSVAKEVVDSLTYHFEAKIDSIRKTKPKWKTSPTVHDTVNTTDTLYLNYWSMFALGDSTLGVKGKVSFDMKDFSFQDIIFNTMSDSVFVVDSVKTTIVKTEPFYQDNWFYATVGLLLLFLGTK